MRVRHDQAAEQLQQDTRDRKDGQKLAEVVLHPVTDLLELPSQARGLTPLLAELPRLEHNGAGRRALDVRLAGATALSAAQVLAPSVRPTLEKLSRDRTKNVREVAKLALTPCYGERVGPVGRWVVTAQHVSRAYTARRLPVRTRGT